MPQAFSTLARFCGRFQFRLRTMLIIIAMLCVWPGSMFIVARRQQCAVARIKNAHGVVYYDRDTTPSIAGSRWRRLVAGVFGDDVAYNVVAVGMTRVAAFDFSCLNCLPSLRTLDLSGSDISDEELSTIALGSTLEDLNLTDTRITDVGLGRISHLDSIKYLAIRDRATTYSAESGVWNDDDYAKCCQHEPHITDQGLKELARLPRLERIDVEGNPISDTGLACVKQMAALSYINLRGTNVSQAAVDALKHNMPQLEIERWFKPRNHGLIYNMKLGPSNAVPTH